MKTNVRAVIGALSCFAALVCAGTTLSAGEPLRKATVTMVKNDVRYKPEATSERAAKVSDEVKGADVLRTGERSLAELEFQDKTITRLASNTIFSFKEGTRDLELKKGVILFHVPKGAGGAHIVTSAVTAAITGTTGLGESSGNLAKFIFLEGTGKFQIGKKTVMVGGAEMLIVYDNGKFLKAPIDLKTLFKTSQFLNGALGALKDWDKEGLIDKNIQTQEKEKKLGLLEPTNSYIAGTGDKLVTKGGGSEEGSLLTNFDATANWGTPLIGGGQEANVLANNPRPVCICDGFPQ